MANVCRHTITNLFFCLVVCMRVYRCVCVYIVHVCVRCLSVSSTHSPSGQPWINPHGVTVLPNGRWVITLWVRFVQLCLNNMS
jgi:hypothetical protein